MTTTRFKDFGGNSSGEKPPLSFKLHEEEFNCLPALQGKVLLDLVSKANSGDAAASASIMSEFFEHALTDESFVRFDSMLKSKDKIVQVETLSEIVSWLIGEYSDRPNSQPEAS
jgi:hypothetical protein